jgi:hypothetical protein
MGCRWSATVLNFNNIALTGKQAMQEGPGMGLRHFDSLKKNSWNYAGLKKNYYLN